MKSYKARGYTMTVADSVSAGKHVLELTCTCATHDGTSGVAVLATPTSAVDFPKSRIHGHVTLAHSPMGAALPHLWKGQKA